MEKSTREHKSSDGAGPEHPAFCTPDGPGIRTTVFLKGCSLRCKWCSIPRASIRSQSLRITLAKCHW